MSLLFPTSQELYKTITNDCFAFFLEQNNEKSIKELYKTKKNNISIKDKLNKLKLIISDNKANNQKHSDIIHFTSKYINIMHAFFEKDKIDNSEVRFLHQYCLSYISLVGFRCLFSNNINDDQIFKFQVNEYKEFSKFLIYYSITEQVQNFYEENSIQIQADFKDSDNLYLNLIIKFDADRLFYPQIIKENNGYESFNDDISKTTNLSDNSYIMRQKQNNCDERTLNNENEINELQKNNININKVNNIQNIFEKLAKMESEIESLKSDNRLLKGKSIKTDFEIIKVRFKLLETNEYLECEKSFNDAYLKVGKAKIQYLEKYNQTLQNELINLLNPYNLIFWRKISNIILKNIFIILLHKKYIIKQNKSQSILIVLKSKDEKFKITDNKTKDIDKRIKIFQESLKHEKTNIKTDSHKSIIIFNEEGEAYINDSLSIGFLFYLREKSNKASQDNDIKIEELKILNEGKNGLIKVKEIKEEKDDDSHQIEVNEKEEEIINNKIIEIKKVGLNR